MNDYISVVLGGSPSFFFGGAYLPVNLGEAYDLWNAFRKTLNCAYNAETVAWIVTRKGAARQLSYVDITVSNPVLPSAMKSQMTRVATTWQNSATDLTTLLEFACSYGRQALFELVSGAASVDSDANIVSLGAVNSADLTATNETCVTSSTAAASIVLTEPFPLPSVDKPSESVLISSTSDMLVLRASISMANIYSVVDSFANSAAAQGHDVLCENKFLDTQSDGFVGFICVILLIDPVSKSQIKSQVIFDVLEINDGTTDTVFSNITSIEHQATERLLQQLEIPNIVFSKDYSNERFFQDRKAILKSCLLHSRQIPLQICINDANAPLLKALRATAMGMYGFAMAQLLRAWADATAPINSGAVQKCFKDNNIVDSNPLAGVVFYKPMPFDASQRTTRKVPPNMTKIQKKK